MLYFNIKRLLNLRGIDKHYAFLVKNGFVSQTATNLANNGIGHIKPAQMEKLCVLLNCTPNDLFSWKPDDEQTATENHPLAPLHRDKQSSERLDEMLKSLPVSKIGRLAEMIDELNSGER
jgi:DNA-binding Xre family transcriptional regulator